MKETTEGRGFGHKGRSKRGKRTSEPKRQANPKISSKLRKIVDVLLDKKCEDIVIVDLRRFNHICDFFVICNSFSHTQTEAVIYDLKKLSKNEKKMGIKHVDFNPTSLWNVVDFGDVIVHIFDKERRKFYDLEGLWIDAKKLYVNPDGSVKTDHLEHRGFDKVL